MKKYKSNYKSNMEQTMWANVETGFNQDDLIISKKEKNILRNLATKVASLANGSIEKEKIELWKKTNSLIKTRPVFFCRLDNAWNEIINEEQMQCTGKIARRWEMDLRKEIFYGEQLEDDKPIRLNFNVPYTAIHNNWGFDIFYRQVDKDGSYTWDGPLKDYDRDFKKLKFPEVIIDYITTNGCLSLAEEIFGDILEVKLKSLWWWTLGLTHTAVLLRGFKEFLYDFKLNPGNLKSLIHFISKGINKKLDYLENNGLLSLNNGGIYMSTSGLGYTDELPQKDFDGKHIRCSDLWGFAESQETVGISPVMYEEFVFNFQKTILDRFGLNVYGCCEQLHDRWNIIKKYKNLRKISVSRWSNLEKMVNFLGDKYVISIKLDPLILAINKIDQKNIRHYIRDILDKTKGCIIEFIMQDNHTIGNKPENVINFSRIMREELKKYD